MEQFNPSLRNFIAMGKNYEKALAGIPGPWPLAHRWTSLQPGQKPLGLLSQKRLVEMSRGCVHPCALSVTL